MKSTSKGLLGRITAAGCLLAAAAACSAFFPGTPAGPTAIPSPSATPFSAHAFLQSADAEASQYPSRYYPPEGDFSMDVPTDWLFNQKPDSGQELDSISDIHEGKPVAAIYILKKFGKDKSAQQAIDAFYQLPGISDRHMEVSDQAEFPNTTGISGWKVNGTVISDPAQGTREKCILIAYTGGENAYVLAAYPDRSVAPETFPTAFEKMAGSLRWEETRTREIEKTNALQLSADETVVLDPAVTIDGAGGMIGDIFSGLVALDASMNVQPGLAERWDITPDGMTYTFHLRQNAVFHNGRPVTAEDVLFSWLRAASPELNSNTAVLYLGDIAGLREYHAGKADAVSGLHVVDSRTIQVTLDAAKPFFLGKLTYPTSWIVDRYNVRFPNWQFNPNGTGPFRVAQHVKEKSLLLESNASYYNTPPQLQFLLYWMTTTTDETLYKTDKIDRMTASESFLPQVNDPRDPFYGIVTVEQKLCTHFVQFNTARAPFDDPLVRKAFSLAINREIYAEVTAEEGDFPGMDILPPGMTGYSSESTRKYYDPEAAKTLLSQSRYFNGSQSTPEILFTLQSESGQYDSTIDFLITSWEKILGVNIFVEGLSKKEYQNRLKNNPSGQLIFASHCADYPDPENFYNFLFHGANAGMYYGYQNGSLDALLDSAASETDWARRMELYRQADQIIYDDAPAIVLSYSGPSYVVWKPRVMGFVPTPIDIPQHQLLWIYKE
jgi:oligopeptide transport system substrate-binding protein